MILNHKNAMRTKKHLDKQLKHTSDKQLQKMMDEAECNPDTAL